MLWKSLFFLLLALPVAADDTLSGVLEQVEETVRDGMGRAPESGEPAVELQKEEVELEQEAPPEPFVEKVPLHCFDLSIRTRYKGKSYASCSARGELTLTGPAASTDSVSYKRWVHRHVHQAAACFGADPAVLFALWSGESGFQVNIKNAEGGPATGFSQFLVGGPVSSDFIQAVAKFQYGKAAKIPADALSWVPDESRAKLKDEAACRRYLGMAFWAADRMARGTGYCGQARDLVNTEGANLERSVELNTVVGVINHMRALHYARRGLEALDAHLERNVPSAADREKIRAAVKIQAGWGQGGALRAAEAVRKSGVRSFEEFDQKLGRAKEFDLYARAKVQTFRERLALQAVIDGVPESELQKCAPFVKSPSR